MDPLLLISIALGLLGSLSSVLAQAARRSEKAAPYRELLDTLERVLTGKPISTRPLEVQLEEAVGELAKSSRRVGDILTEVQADVDRRRREADQLRMLIEDLRREYEANKSLASLTTEQAGAVRQILSSEVSVLKRRSYLPDILINFGVGAVFFALGIAATVLLTR